MIENCCILASLCITHTAYPEKSTRIYLCHNCGCQWVDLQWANVSGKMSHSCLNLERNVSGEWSPYWGAKWWKELKGWQNEKASLRQFPCFIPFPLKHGMYWSMQLLVQQKYLSSPTFSNQFLEFSISSYGSSACWASCWFLGVTASSTVGCCRASCSQHLGLAHIFPDIFVGERFV